MSNSENTDQEKATPEPAPATAVKPDTPTGTDSAPLHGDAYSPAVEGEEAVIPIPAVEAEPFHGNIDLASAIRNARVQEPPPVYVESFPNQVHRSGVLLTEQVLKILGGSLLILILFSWWSNYRIVDFQKNAHDDIFAEIHEFYVDSINTEKLDAAIQTLKSIRANVALESKKTNLQKELLPALQVIDEVGFRRKKLDGNKWDGIADAIRLTVVNPSLLASGNALETAADALEAIKVVSVSSADRAEIIKTLREIQKDYREENRSNRDFVIQMSQMVLLNLLLPVLTALLGYVFGSRSEQPNNNNKK